MIGGLLDTVLNLTVFAYLAFLGWLAVHPYRDP